MAILREHPYNQFNFLVDVGAGAGTDSVDAGFAEVTGLDVGVEVIEYRNGNSKSNEPIKINGLTRVGDVTLKRGVIGSLTLWEWFREVNVGTPNAIRDVVIHLLNEDRSETVMTWKLARARPVRPVSGPLNATGTDLAIEELVLAYERLQLE
jgi:phage tail-like protein